MDKWEKDFDERFSVEYTFRKSHSDFCITMAAMAEVKDFFRPLIPRWVSVREKLPQLEGWYQTRSIFYKGETAGYYGRSFCKQGMPMIFPKYVTHWLEFSIPELPEEEHD